MKLVHVVVTDAFAGTERYVTDVATELAARGHDVTVVGGHPASMRRHLGTRVRFRPGATPGAAVRSLLRCGRADIVHAHLTYAEVAAVFAHPRNGGRLVVTRHLATPRGRSRLGGLLAPLVDRVADRQIAISDFVARSVPEPVDLVIRNGVAAASEAADPDARTVVMVQRLEPEKDTLTGVRAWLDSGLASLGWRLVIAGSGSEEPRIRELLRGRPEAAQVTLLGHVDDVPTLLRSAGIVLATAVAEPLGLTVLEAMAAGVAVVATAAGGHLETIGEVEGAAMFPPGDVRIAMQLLRALVEDEQRRRSLAAAGRLRQRSCHTLTGHVDALEGVYR